jgi:N12 class adenine-specific DNA methylase
VIDWRVKFRNSQFQTWALKAYFRIFDLKSIYFLNNGDLKKMKKIYAFNAFKANNKISLQIMEKAAIFQKKEEKKTYLIHPIPNR